VPVCGIFLCLSLGSFFWGGNPPRIAATGQRRPIGCLIFTCHFRKRDMRSLALLRKITCNLRHPMGLRRPVCSCAGHLTTGGSTPKKERKIRQKEGEHQRRGCLHLRLGSLFWGGNPTQSLRSTATVRVRGSLQLFHGHDFAHNTKRWKTHFFFYTNSE